MSFDPISTLHELQAKLNELQQIGHIGSWTHDVVTGEVTWSDETFRLFGLESSGKVPPFQTFLERIHPQDRDEVDERYRNAMTTPQSFEAEFRVLHPDGVVKWVESRAHPRFDAQGRLLRIEGTNQDVTFRKQRELDKLEEQQRLRSAFDHMLEGLQVVDFEGLIQYINHAGVLQARCSRLQIEGRPFVDVYPKIKGTALHDALRRCLTRRTPVSLRTNFGFDDVAESGFEVSIQPVPEGALILSFDVTPQQLAEQQLAAKEAELQAFFESASVGMSVWGFNGKPIRWNAASARMLGYSHSEYGDLHVAKLVYPDEWEDSQRMLAKLATGELRNYQTHRRYLRKDGSILHALVYVTVSRFDHGLPSSFAVVLIDRSSYVDLEEKFRRSQKMEAIGRLAGGVAHDFNNLLTVILCSGEILAMHDGLPGDLAPHVKAIQQAAQRGSDLTKQLLAFSRRQVLAPQKIDLNTVLQKSSFLLKRLVGQNVELHLTPSETLPLIKADPGQLEQVLLNLVINARDAVPTSGGRIDVAIAFLPDYAWEEKLMNPHPQPGAVVLQVTDNGPGIPLEIQSRIFEPFFTTKSSGKGTGLGLAVVHGIVEQSGGRIAVESTPGQGTKMEVHFPIVDPS